MTTRVSNPSSNNSTSIHAVVPKDQQKQAVKYQPLFSTSNEVFAFDYDKNSKQWKDKSLGSISFYRYDGNRIFIQQEASTLLCHYVDASIPLQKTIIQSQSWVFRGYKIVNGVKQRDVLCIQFHKVEEATSFFNKYEECRMSMLDSTNQTNKQSSTATTINANAASASNGSIYKSVSGAANNQCETPEADDEQGRLARSVMRRRLSITGNNAANIDGHEVGSHSQPADTVSPVRSVEKAITKRSVNDENVISQPDFSSNQSKQQQQQAAGGIVGATKPSKRVTEMISFSGICKKGVAPYNPDKPNQDSMVMQQFPMNSNCKGEILFCVFDGHGENGHLVSRYMKNRVPQLLAQSPNFKHNIDAALRYALSTGEQELISNTDIDTTLSGSTAVVTVIRNDELIVANVGDSRIVRAVEVTESTSVATAAKIIEGTGAVYAPAVKTSKTRTEIIGMNVSNDHKPDLASEKARIESQGGRVFAMKYDDGIEGPPRVWLSYANTPGLAMSRSVCDTIAKEAGVISEPDIIKLKLTEDDKFIIIATDGLWEFVSTQEAVDIAKKHIIGKQTPDPQSAIKELIEESSKRWLKEEPVIDDTTIIIAVLC